MNLWASTSSTLLSLSQAPSLLPKPMTIQNPFVALILLTSLLCVNGQTKESASGSRAAAGKRSIGKRGQVTQDSINITIAEVSHAKAFMDSILKLKSLANVKGTPGDELLQCVGGLTDGMCDVISKLKKLEQHDSSSSLYGGTRSLENTVDGVVSFTDLCDRALGDVDRTIKLMVHRKLEDIVLLTNDVIFRVSKFQFDGKAAKATGKP